MKYLSLIIVLLISFLGLSQSQNDWKKKSAFSGGKRTRAIAFSIDDFGYVGMGEDTVEMTHNDLWKYDPALDSWTQVADLPGPTRRNAVAVTLNGKGYVGLGADSSVSYTGTILSDWWEYDPLGNNWTSKASYPGGYNYVNTYYGPGVYFATAFEINNMGYICGGKMGGDLYAADLWEYNPQLDQWTRKADFPGSDRYQLSSFGLEGKGYVGMGIDHDLFHKDWWQYDPNTDSWQQVANLPGVERGSSSTFVIGQRGFVVFGTDGGYKDELWEYNPFTNSWSIRANFPGGERKNAIAFAIGDSAYAGIGQGSSGKRQNFYRYYPLFPVGFNDIVIDLNVFPNPVKDMIHISSGDQNEHLSFELFDLQGRFVFSSEENNADLTDISEGSYILNAFGEQKQHLKTVQIIIQR